MINRRWLLFLPFVLFILMCIFCWRGLSLDPHLLPSTLLNKPLPRFQIATLAHPQHSLSNADFLGKITLLNVWATWCASCSVEHAVLLELARNPAIQLIGLDYKDERAAALRLLKQQGNPYNQVGFDQTGALAIELGVYGTPETFVIDRQGIVRYKYVGPLTHDAIQKTLLPIINKLAQSTERF